MVRIDTGIEITGHDTNKLLPLEDVEVFNYLTDSVIKAFLEKNGVLNETKTESSGRVLKWDDDMVRRLGSDQRTGFRDFELGFNPVSNKMEFRTRIAPVAATITCHTSEGEKRLSQYVATQTQKLDHNGNVISEETSEEEAKIGESGVSGKLKIDGSSDPMQVLGSVLKQKLHLDIDTDFVRHSEPVTDQIIEKSGGFPGLVTEKRLTTVLLELKESSFLPEYVWEENLFSDNPLIVKKRIHKYRWSTADSTH